MNTSTKHISHSRLNHNVNKYIPTKKNNVVFTELPIITPPNYKQFNELPANNNNTIKLDVIKKEILKLLNKIHIIRDKYSKKNNNKYTYPKALIDNYLLNFRTEEYINLYRRYLELKTKESVDKVNNFTKEFKLALEKLIRYLMKHNIKDAKKLNSFLSKSLIKLNNNTYFNKLNANIKTNINKIQNTSKKISKKYINNTIKKAQSQSQSQSQAQSQFNTNLKNIGENINF